MIYSRNKKKHVLLWQYNRYKNYFTTIIILSSLILCLSQPSTSVQNSHGLLLLMGCLLACLIPTVPVRAWVDWCPLPDVGPGSVYCGCACLLNMSQSPDIIPTGHQYSFYESTDLFIAIKSGKAFFNTVFLKIKTMLCYVMEIVLWKYSSPLLRLASVQMQDNMSGCHRKEDGYIIWGIKKCSLHRMLPHI
jgi:hypothetical protein